MSKLKPADAEMVVKALAKLCDEKRIKRSGSGKKGEPFTYKRISVFPFPDTNGNGGTESETASKPVSNKDLFRSRDFPELDSVPGVNENGWEVVR